MEQTLYMQPAAAYVRGMALRARDGLIVSEDPDVNGRPLALPPAWLETPIAQLDEQALCGIIERGREAGLKLYRFKNTHDQLPRVKRVLGYLRGQAFDSLLDVGSGRGVFLWPFLQAFPWVETTCIDLLAYRVQFLTDVSSGGLPGLTVMRGDMCRVPQIPDKSRDIVTMLEVLEHIPDPAAALRSAVRIARRSLILSVPNQPDNNPEHIHLFTKSSMTARLREAGCGRIRFDAVPGHMIVFAQVEE